MNMFAADASLVLMITIVDRDDDERMLELFAGESVIYNLLTMGEGTANSRILDCMGLGATEKTLLFSMMPLSLSGDLLKKLRKKIRLDKPGRGIAFTLPVESVCGVPGLSLREGDTAMEQNAPHNLIITIANQGFSSEVMEAAKQAQATGGTVIDVRSISLKESAKFFGVPIQPEKELILILAPGELKQAIMEAITARAGLQTDAQAVVFSLPVNDVAGIAPAVKTKKT